VTLESVQRKPSPSASTSAENDAQLFDVAHYRSRMLRHLDPNNELNKVFFDALSFASELHSGQLRKSGAPYISHPCAVAEILARELRIKDPVLLAAALLHDVVEDIPSLTIDDIEHRFGPVVAELVDGCTKLTRRHLDRATLKDLTHSKIFLSASRHLGVIVIKLADRLHNLRTLHFLPQAKRQRIAQETVEVYAPIAARLNIFPLKRELYHQALTFLYPRKSKKILQFIRELRDSDQVMEVENALQKAFSDANLPATIRPRAKGLGSYYDPLKRTLDLSNGDNHVDFAVIIASEDVIDCYRALGIVNLTFPAIPRTLRDFVTNPKNNGYRSLHVRIHVGGQNYLVKIRTPEMDKWAAYGLLRNWSIEKTLSEEHWHEISELLRSIGEYVGAGPQRKALIRLSETEEIFVYSPKGDIYYLPKGSIVLDFAYRIHSELGDYCDGALVNNEWSPVTQPLKDGDTVEIITSPDPMDVQPHLEELCKTPKARTSINRQLQQRIRQYAYQAGRQILIQELRRHGLTVDLLEGEQTMLLLEILNLKDPSDLYVRVGEDLLSAHLVLYYLESPREERERPQDYDSSISLPSERNSLLVTDIDEAVHKFARCCNPYPGQEGLVATLSERGITFHHRDCEDLLQRHNLQPQHLLNIEWSRDTVWRRRLVFHLHVLQETPATILQFLAELPEKIDIQSIERAVDKHDRPMVNLTVIFKDFEETESFFRRFPGGQIIIESYLREKSSIQPGRTA
jgi:guanosine-3',5'-bis(diphosphate) 3'-pyrophosphohydrolase